jgi:CRISPR-associated protein Csx3
MATYKIELEDGNVLKLGFGDPAQNDQIVRDAYARLTEMMESGELSGGEIVKINGPASLPVAMVIAHAIAHRYGAVACFDPKLGKYVVSIAHGDQYSVGDLIE